MERYKLKTNNLSMIFYVDITIHTFMFIHTHDGDRRNNQYSRGIFDSFRETSLKNQQAKILHCQEPSNSKVPNAIAFF